MVHNRFEVACLVSCVAPERRDYHPDRTPIGVQYDPGRQTSLARMASFGLTSDVCNFEPFVNLRQLNLRGNQLATLAGLGLHTLPHLRVLDCSHNLLKDLKELAAVLDNLRALECAAVRENPCTRGKDRVWRQKLIGAMKSMREVECTLRVIDTVVTVEDRAVAWKKRGGGSPAEIQRLRSAAFLYQRIPTGTDPAAIRSLDLSFGEFKAELDLRPFTGVEVLLLAGNKLEHVDTMGLDTLVRLKVLDLRDNFLCKGMRDWLASSIDRGDVWPLLSNLGLRGNSFCKGGTPRWRIKFLSLIPRLWTGRLALTYLDEQEIKVQEVVDAWRYREPEAKADKANLHFRILLVRKLPEGAKVEDVTDLDLSGHSLPSADMRDFKGLLRLSLARNSLPSLRPTHLQACAQLRALDLSYNRLKDLGKTVVVLASLRYLENVSLKGNPCYSTGERKERQALMKAWMQAEHQPHALHAFPLRMLDGRVVAVEEVCLALKDATAKSKVFDTPALQLQVALSREPRLTQDGTILDLSRCALSSLPPLHKHLSGITALNLSGNELKRLDTSVLGGLPSLETLDLRTNCLISLKHILSVLKGCSALSMLYVKNATSGKDTAKPRKYLGKVCSALQQLQEVDGLPNPRPPARRTKGRDVVTAAPAADGGSKPRQWESSRRVSMRTAYTDMQQVSKIQGRRRTPTDGADEVGFLFEEDDDDGGVPDNYELKRLVGRGGGGDGLDWNMVYSQRTTWEDFGDV